MPFNEFITGPQNVSGDGQQIKARAGRQGDQLASELHGRYYEQTVRGNMYFAASQVAAASSATPFGLQTTYLGLCIFNPINTRINMVLNKVSIMQSVIQSGNIEAYAIATGWNGTTTVTNTSALAVHNALLNGPIGVGQASVSATLPTAPFYTYFVQNTQTIAIDGTAALFDLEGAIILPPGGYACWVTPTQQSVTGLWFGFVWEEVPVL